MGYDHYCLHCGRKLNQNSQDSEKKVLFDMQRLLSGEESSGQKLTILKFRLTQNELIGLINSGEKAEDGFRRCTLKFSTLANYMSNQNNLKDARIAGLSIEGIRDYCDIFSFGSGAVSAQSPAFNQNVTAGSAYDIGDFFAAEEPKEQDEENTEHTDETAQKEPEKQSAGNKGNTDKDAQEEKKKQDERKRQAEIIQVLEEESRIIASDALITKSLKEELEYLVRLMPEKDEFSFLIKGKEEEYEDGKKILTGYSFKYILGKTSTREIIVNEARVCGRCGTEVFQYAGTAQHQTVAFVGFPASGKTSTILAMASYVGSERPSGEPNSGFWSKGKIISSEGDFGVKLSKPSEKLTEDLDGYNNEGKPPKKTEANKREDAYSATFRVQYGSRYRLLTLTDLPGELCISGGEIDESKVKNEFPVAVSCDAYVACFDTQSPENKTESVCSWVENFQKLRTGEGKEDSYAPTMLLFTKCREIEEGLGEADRNRSDSGTTPEQSTYALHDERMAIEETYSYTLKKFSGYGTLKRAYQAMLRCSPFGYDPQKNETLRLPQPKNIELLLCWLLSVTGCIPYTGIYKVGSGKAISNEVFYVDRPQVRRQNPQNKQEAAARCTLFANPGKYDRELLGRYNDRWALFPCISEMCVRPDSNCET